MPLAPNRRQFLQSSLATGAATLTGAHTLAAAPTTTVNLGIIGCGSIMNHHVKGLVARKENIRVTHLCDVDPGQIATIAKHLDRFQATRPLTSSTFETVIADKNVDAVVIATPHHWHAPMTMAAMMEGKDVYIEKPISHVYNEGPLIVEAARKYNRVVQQGSQMRNSPVTRQAEQLLQQGIIGEVKIARAWTAEIRKTVKPVPDSAPPQGVDYDRWLGPAPQRPFNRHRFHRTWRMFRDYGNGEIGDDGIHDLDLATWGLGVTTLPKQITARGSRMLLHGHHGDYPDNLNVTYEYPDGRLLIYENYPFTAYGMHGFDNGNVFYGTKGYMIFSRRGAFKVFLGPKNQPGPTEDRGIRGQRGYAEHMAEFLEAVRERTAVKADPLTAHRGCALVHLGEIAYRTSGRLDFDPKTERFVDNSEANSLLDKQYRAPFGMPR